MADINAHLDRLDHQHAKDEKPADCMICRAETWVDDLKSRGLPLNEIRNMHMIASHTAMEREALRKKHHDYMVIFMYLVHKLGDSVSLLPEEMKGLKGRLVQESEGDGLKFTITDSPAGMKIN